MGYQPSALVSMQFFIAGVARSTTTQKSTENDTVFFNDNGTQAGTASTTREGTTFSSRYFDTQGALIGTSVGEWGGSVVTTTYYVNKQKVGTSTTNWGGSDHETDYFDLNGTQIARSHTTKMSDTSQTQYNLPLKPKREASSVAKNSSATFASNPKRQERQPNADANKKQGKCCSIM